MKRLTFYEPEDLSAEVVSSVLGLVGVKLAPAAVRDWTELEQLVAYDWAIREHLIASDNHQVKRRNKPWFIDAAYQIEEGMY